MCVGVCVCCIYECVFDRFELFTQLDQNISLVCSYMDTGIQGYRDTGIQG